MSKESQRVVLIQDASREVSSSAIRWALHGLSLKSGDMLTLLSVLHQVINPSTLTFMGAGKLMGYKSRADSSMFGSNQKIVEDEVAKKKKEYQNNVELIQISKLYEMQKIEFQIIVDAGPSPKVVALEAAKRLGATWVILDRQMKKDKKYFLGKLSCGISRMKRDNNVEQLRGPKAADIKNFPIERSRTCQITYDEMLPGSPELDDLFSIELLPTMFTSCLESSESTSSTLTEERCTPHHCEEKNSMKKNIETVKNEPLDTISTKREMCSIEAYVTREDELPSQCRSSEDVMGSLKPEVIYDNSVCTVCKNRQPKIKLERDFTYAELQAATNGFSTENVISEGASGVVFRGHLKHMITIAVKDATLKGEKKFKSEVKALRRIRHKNVVMLFGTCSEGSHRFLVYEYVCNGSLEELLKNHSCVTLNWGERMKIALGAARGLNNLHENNIIHRDMKPRNIFVTHDHEPLLGGFGVATTCHDSDQSSDQRVVGTFGYLAPEYAESGKASTKTDIYSYGVVLLELITGWSSVDKRLEEKSLLRWARPILKQKNYPDLIDPSIINSRDRQQSIWMVQVAEKCLSKDPQRRLSIDKVVSSLENILEGRAPWRMEVSNSKSDT